MFKDILFAVYHRANQILGARQPQGGGRDAATPWRIKPPSTDGTMQYKIMQLLHHHYDHDYVHHHYDPDHAHGHYHCHHLHRPLCILLFS